MPIRLTPKPRVQPHNGAKFAYVGADMSTFRPAKVGRASLAGWKSPDVKPLGVNRIGMLLQWISRPDRYARIVVVAHSQGTVISAELLRLLQADEELANRVFEKQKPEIRLVSAGSPLRQLYAQRFPDEYGWAAQEATGGARSPAALRRQSVDQHLLLGGLCRPRALATACRPGR